MSLSDLIMDWLSNNGYTHQLIKASPISEFPEAWYIYITLKHPAKIIGNIPLLVHEDKIGVPRLVAEQEVELEWISPVDPGFFDTLLQKIKSWEM